MKQRQAELAFGPDSQVQLCICCAETYLGQRVPLSGAVPGAGKCRFVVDQDIDMGQHRYFRRRQNQRAGQPRNSTRNSHNKEFITKSVHIVE